ncbi:MAG: SPOR domain-containing protein [Candidatus Cloacimonetes bacterium]|nr:SPOR domain-containing protein [Candidatus Cloacimonadota bacterium]
MMKRTLVIILIICALILSFSLFTGCAKKKAPEKEIPEPVKTEEPIVEKPKVTPQKETEKVTEEVKKEIRAEITEIEEKVFELQMVAVRDYSRIDIEKNKLAQYGYNTKITTTEKDGETFYRLRLDGLYTHSEAVTLGEKLKKQFPSIHEYWVQKVK